MSAQKLKIWQKDKPIFDKLKLLDRASLLEVPVTVVPFGNRAQAVFLKYGIKTIGGLARLSRYELLKMRNLGRNTVGVVIYYLEELGLSLGLPQLQVSVGEVTKEEKMLLLMERQKDLLKELDQVTQQLREAL